MPPIKYQVEALQSHDARSAGKLLSGRMYSFTQEYIGLTFATETRVALGFFDCRQRRRQPALLNPGRAVSASGKREKGFRPHHLVKESGGKEWTTRFKWAQGEIDFGFWVRRSHPFSDLCRARPFIHSAPLLLDLNTIVAQVKFKSGSVT